MEGNQRSRIHSAPSIKFPLNSRLSFMGRIKAEELVFEILLVRLRKESGIQHYNAKPNTIYS